MITIRRTDSGNEGFKMLVKELDADLAIRDGDDHAFYDQYNKIDLIKNAVVAYLGDAAVGCGAIKQYDETTMEVKRMYVLPVQRGKGIAHRMLTHLEEWAKELGYANCILETGINQPEAIALYNKAGYASIENYGQYEGVATSKCFRKML